MNGLYIYNYFLQFQHYQNAKCDQNKYFDKAVKYIF